MKKNTNSTLRKNRLAALRKLFLQLDDKLARCAPFAKAAKEERCAYIMLLCSAHQISIERESEQNLAELMNELLQKVESSYSNANPFFDSSGDRVRSRMALCVEELESDLVKHKDLIAAHGFTCQGYFYQWMCEQNRREALKRVQQADKQTSRDDLIHFTQLYTPAWITDYLLRETISPCLKERPAGALQELRVLDPACGGGHILIRAFKYIVDLYKRNEIEPALSIERILNFNLRGCDIDKGALWTCALALVSAATAQFAESKIVFWKMHIKLQLFDVSQEDDITQVETGSLASNFGKDHPLADGADCVLANPPYIGRRLMDRRLKTFLRENYKSAHHDLSAAFLVRALELAEPRGYVGFITQSSLLFLPSYEKLRQQWLQNGNLVSVVELGPGAFPLQSGEKINSMLIVLKAGAEEAAVSHPMSFLDLRNSDDKESDLAKEFLIRYKEDFISQRASSFNYRCPLSISQLFAGCRKLSEIADIKQGLATSDNQRFLRYWWEVPEEELNVRWHPYVKGAGSERWSAPIETVVDWGIDGKDIKEAVGKNYPYLEGKISWVVKNEPYYFREGLTFSFVNTGQFAVRKMPQGCIFDVGGSSIFPIETSIEFLLAYLNSSFIVYCAELLNPTFNCQVGDLKQLPCLDFTPAQAAMMEQLGSEALHIKMELDRFKENAFAFQPPAEITRIIQSKEEPEQVFQRSTKDDRQRLSRLDKIERDIDDLIIHSLSNHKLNADEIREVENQLSSIRKTQTEPIFDKRFFAGLILRESIRQLERSRQDAGAPGIEPKIAASPSGAVVNDLVIALAQNGGSVSDSIAKALGFAPNLVRWLEEVLATSLFDWFISHYNDSQLAIFRSTPQTQLIEANTSELRFRFSNTAREKPAHPVTIVVSNQKSN